MHLLLAWYREGQNQIRRAVIVVFLNLTVEMWFLCKTEGLAAEVVIERLRTRKNIRELFLSDLNERT